MPSRVRQIYQTDLLYVFPTGINPATGAANFGAIFNNPANAGLSTGAFTGVSLVSELFRVQKIDHGWTKTLSDVNQFGELAAIDRVVLEQPTVNLSASWILSNLINESLIGLFVNKAGDTAAISTITGLLDGSRDPKNYAIKIVGEGQDASNNSTVSYNSVAFGNCFIDTYTSQGQVGSFPTVDVTWQALNTQADAFVANTGAVIPAVNPSNGLQVTGFFYQLPTGTSSFGGARLTDNQGVSALRHGDMTLSLGLNQGDTLFDPNDIKVQSYNFSFNMNRENLLKLGSKYAFAKVIRFPLQATLTVNSVVGDIGTGSLVNIITNNGNFNPKLTITKPGDTTTIMAQYTLTNAKLQSENITSNLTANKSMVLTFGSQVGGPTSTTSLYLSGITV